MCRKANREDRHGIMNRYLDTRRGILFTGQDGTYGDKVLARRSGHLGVAICEHAGAYPVILGLHVLPVLEFSIPERRGLSTTTHIGSNN
jgi:hypothetical protein